MKQAHLHNITIINSVLVAISLIYTQAYLICLPDIANSLSALYSNVQLIFTGNILCFGISQFFYGSFSDHYGRKQSLLIGLWIVLAGNILSFFSSNIIMLFIGQLIVGLGAGSCSVIPRAIAKDIFTDTPLVKAISYMSIASTLATGIAPILGSLFQECFGWRSIFLFLIGITIFTLILVTSSVQETVKISNRVLVKYQIVRNYGKLFKNRLFLLYMALNSCAYSVIIVYLILSPFLFQTRLHYLSSENSIVYLLCASSYLIGNILTGKLIEKCNIKVIIRLGIIAIAMGGALVVIPISLHKVTMMELLLCGLLLHFGSGLVTPITYKQILSIQDCSAGMASGAVNAIRVLVAFVFSLAEAYFSLQDSTSLAYSLGILSLGCIGLYFLSSKIIIHKMEGRVA